MVSYFNMRVSLAAFLLPKAYALPVVVQTSESTPCPPGPGEVQVQPVEEVVHQSFHVRTSMTPNTVIESGSHGSSVTVTNAPAEVVTGFVGMETCLTTVTNVPNQPRSAASSYATIVGAHPGVTSPSVTLDPGPNASIGTVVVLVPEPTGAAFPSTESTAERLSIGPPPWTTLYAEAPTTTTITTESHRQPTQPPIFTTSHVGNYVTLTTGYYGDCIRTVTVVAFNPDDAGTVFVQTPTAVPTTNVTGSAGPGSAPLPPTPTPCPDAEQIFEAAAEIRTSVPATSPGERNVAVGAGTTSQSTTSTLPVGDAGITPNAGSPRTGSLSFITLTIPVLVDKPSITFSNPWNPTIAANSIESMPRTSVSGSIKKPMIILPTPLAHSGRCKSARRPIRAGFGTSSEPRVSHSTTASQTPKPSNVSKPLPVSVGAAVTTSFDAPELLPSFQDLAVREKRPHNGILAIREKVTAPTNASSLASIPLRKASIVTDRSTGTKNLTTSERLNLTENSSLTRTLPQTVMELVSVSKVSTRPTRAPLMKTPLWADEQTPANSTTTKTHTGSHDSTLANKTSLIQTPTLTEAASLFRGVLATRTVDPTATETSSEPRDKEIKKMRNILIVDLVKMLLGANDFEKLMWLLGEDLDSFLVGDLPRDFEKLPDVEKLPPKAMLILKKAASIPAGDLAKVMGRLPKNEKLASTADPALSAAPDPIGKPSATSDQPATAESVPLSRSLTSAHKEPATASLPSNGAAALKEETPLTETHSQPTGKTTASAGFSTPTETLIQYLTFPTSVTKALTGDIHLAWNWQ